MPLRWTNKVRGKDRWRSCGALRVTRGQTVNNLLRERRLFGVSSDEFKKWEASLCADTCQQRNQEAGTATCRFKIRLLKSSDVAVRPSSFSISLPCGRVLLPLLPAPTCSSMIGEILIFSPLKMLSILQVLFDFILTFRR